MRYRKSEELKETDLEWFGEVPKSWDIRKLKFLSNVNSSNVNKKSKEGEEVVELCNYTDVYYNEFITNELDFMKATASDKDIERFQLVEGDVIITKDSESQDDMAVPTFVEETKENLLCGYHLALIRSDEKVLNGKYLFRLFQSKKYREEFGIRSNGITRYGLGVHELKNISIHIPPLPEQRSIATFLDRKTEAIDGLIQKKEQLIERLKEKRQALITRAVTKGLDPDVPMKDSGIEWLAEIPEEWEIKRLKFLMETNPSKQEVSDLPGNFEVSFLPMEKVGETGELTLDETKQLKKVFNGYTYFTNEDVTVAKITPCFENGKGALIKDLENEVGFGTTELTVFRPNPQKVLPEYLYYITISYPIRKIGKSFMYGAGGQKRVPDDFFENFQLGIPSIEKQKEIINDLKIELERLFIFRKKIREQIQKLKEYRQSLISAAVTGKIDVRANQELAISDEPRKEISSWDKFVLALEIIKRMQNNQHFGRIMLVKILFLIEYHLRVKGFNSNYKRWDHGPFDNQLINSVEYNLKKDGWIDIDSIESSDYDQKIYTPTGKAYEKSHYFNNSWGDLDDEIQDILNIFNNANSTQAEIIATIYAAYNDLLIEKKEPSEDEVLDEILNNWHPNKKKISRKRWKSAYRWIKEKEFLPTGFGNSTKEAA
ncbi:restriction endonuclease subunit S [Fodinibius salsisoli]|uniref:Restriction endonuclease subunit S n=1 Tax=Fodinibius salsisoli TaxID=2820877 RepID=A0ABT3PSJ8_9BACT|nr:restriction endonuclease subunit S [Fodinibius salsisoli]MCW9708838.1 restriction endonuclease subunit S [Fodinibius salsisoli]